MEPNDMTRFRAVMAGMGKLYEREIDGVLLDAYWLALRDWSLSDFESAAGHLMGHAKFMPRPAEFNELRKAGELTAGEAWEMALSGKVLSGRAERAAHMCGGQARIRMANIETELPHIERRFNTYYEELCDVEDVRESIPQITRQAIMGLRLIDKKIA